MKTIVKVEVVRDNKLIDKDGNIIAEFIDNQWVIKPEFEYDFIDCRNVKDKIEWI